MMTKKRKTVVILTSLLAFVGGIVAVVKYCERKARIYIVSGKREFTS